MKITKSEFGVTSTGEVVNLFHMENNAGAYIEVIDFGARIHKLVVPNKDGELTDVCLSVANMEDYEAERAYYARYKTHFHRKGGSKMKTAKKTAIIFAICFIFFGLVL